MNRSFLLLVLVLSVTATLVSATTIISRSPEELARESALVVDGKVTGLRSYWNDTHTKILTEATIAVDATHKGTAGAQVRVVQLGGVVDNVRMTAHGALGWTRGEEVLLFLESSGPGAYQVAGFSQGKYLIERDTRTGTAYVRQAVPADTKDNRGPSTTDGAPVAATERVGLEQFLERVLPRR